MSEQRFKAEVERAGPKGWIRLPFDPDEVWGRRDRHHITGTIHGHKIRGPLARESEYWGLSLGPAWIRDNPVPNSPVEVVIAPEGPQVPEDLAERLRGEPEAEAFFLSLATFYRKGYIRWIEDAKRPETRQKRVEETLACLKEGKKAR